MPSKSIRYFHYSAGALLLAVAAASFFSSRVGATIILPPDPVFTISIRNLFWILSGICLAVGVFTLAGKPRFMRVMVIAGLATVLLIYRLGCLWHGVHGLGGYLGSFSDAFGVSAATAGIMAEVTLVYLVLGSYFALAFLWWQNRRDAGQQIPGPNCQAAISLPASGNLKMSCVLCGGHIEFPAHAIGQQIQCPHCAKTITLSKPA